MLSKQGQLEDAAFDRALPVDSRSIDRAKARALAAEQVELAPGIFTQLRLSIYHESLGMLIDEQIDLEV